MLGIGNYPNWVDSNYQDLRQWRGSTASHFRDGWCRGLWYVGTLWDSRIRNWQLWHIHMDLDQFVIMGQLGLSKSAPILRAGWRGLLSCWKLLYACPCQFGRLPRLDRGQDAWGQNWSHLQPNRTNHDLIQWLLANPINFRTTDYPKYHASNLRAFAEMRTDRRKRAVLVSSGLELATNLVHFWA